MTVYKRKQEEVRGSWESYPAMMHVWKGSTLYKVVQSRKVLTKLVGVSSSQSRYQRNPTSHRNGPAIVSPAALSHWLGQAPWKGGLSTKILMDRVQHLEPTVN